MLALRSNSPTTALGQSPRELDPYVDIGLNAAGQVLAQNDPGAPETMRLIRRIIVAPPPPWSGWFTPSKGPAISRVSDLNPTLEKVAYIREHPVLVPAAIGLALAGVFALGRASAR